MSLEVIYSFLSSFSPLLIKIVGGVTLLLVVVGVHEFGHFICAKYIGARVDVFSIGFGKPLWKKKWGETEYCLCPIPLGGYVKIYGHEMEEVEADPNPQPDRALYNKSLPGRILVFSGGPIINLLLAVGIFSFLAFIGVEQPPAIATRVVTYSPAWTAGLRSGDRIVSVNNKEVIKFMDVQSIISKNPNTKIPFQIKRGEKLLNIMVAIQGKESYSPYGETITSGKLDYFSPFGLEPVVGSTVEKNAWNLKPEDKILSINNKKVHSWEDIESFLEKNLKSLPPKLTFTVQRGKETLTVDTPNLSWLYKRINREWNAQRLMETVGLYSKELFVGELLPGGPAEKAGIQPGDRIISINNKKIYSFEQLRASIQIAGIEDKNKQAKENPQVQLLIERKGKTKQITSNLQVNSKKDPLGKLVVTYAIGILSKVVPIKPKEIILERTLNPFKALWAGIQETSSKTVMTVIGLKKFVFGEVSSRALSGPIMILTIAGNSFHNGLRQFINLMAYISIALGVFNLIPLPVLDGGHILFALIEGVRGKPLSPVIVQNAMKLGVSLLILLMLFATYNDLLKIFSF